MPLSTPKFKSGEFKAALSRVKEVFDAQSLAIVLVDALERKSAEQIFTKSSPKGQKARLKNVAKSELVGHITGGFFAAPQIAYQVMKELDRSCQKERHIVASIPEAQASDRVGSYRAIALKRERAKFVWALARDDRDAVRVLANRIINEFFQEVASFEKAKAVTDGEASVDTLGDDTQLATKIRDQAEQLGEATQAVNQLETKLGNFESERATLLVQMGAKERLLKQQTEKRGELESELNELREQFKVIETEHEELEQAKTRAEEARRVAEELAQKVRRLEKLAGASDSLVDVQTKLEKSQKEIEELSRENKRLQSLATKTEQDLNRELEKSKTELEHLRDELKRARKHITTLEERPIGEEVPRAEAGVNILLDQANLAGVAHQVYKRKVNFASLLNYLAEGRTVAKAVAFVVDNGGTAFDGFCDVLRRAGWELRIKKPKRFSDGKTKADWDMAIAMEALEHQRKAKDLVLVSGDGDFAPLIKRLQRNGQKVEVACFSEGLAQEAREAADRVIFLDASSLEA